MASSLPDQADAFPYASSIRRFTREEYQALIAAGVLHEDENVELLDGVIVPMTPQGADHSRTVGRLNKVLLPALLGRADLLVQSPFAAADGSEPEPDLLIFPLGTDESDHPTRAWCVIEVAVTSQRRDRARVAVYARADVDQVILIDIPRREARVFRNPSGGDYERLETVREGTPIPIDAFPDVAFDLATVLPAP